MLDVAFFLQRSIGETNLRIIGFKVAPPISEAAVLSPPAAAVAGDGPSHSMSLRCG